jgi:hypothetical protein
MLLAKMDIKTLYRARLFIVLSIFSFDAMQMNEYITYCASRYNSFITQTINFYSPIKHHSLTTWLSGIIRTMRSNISVRKKINAVLTEELIYKNCDAIEYLYPNLE